MYSDCYVKIGPLTLVEFGWGKLGQSTSNTNFKYFSKDKENITAKNIRKASYERKEIHGPRGIEPYMVPLMQDYFE